MNLTDLLTDLSTHYNAIIRDTASQFSLTTSQAFHILSIPSDGISISQLAYRLGLDTSTLTRNIQKLESKKLLTRSVHLYDKRVQNIQLTDKGLKTVASIDLLLKDINYSIMENIDLDSQQNIIDSLEKLSWSLECVRENNV